MALSDWFKKQWRELPGGLKVKPDGYKWDRKKGKETVEVTKRKGDKK